MQERHFASWSVLEAAARPADDHGDLRGLWSVTGVLKMLQVLECASVSHSQRCFFDAVCVAADDMLLTID